MKKIEVNIVRNDLRISKLEIFEEGIKITYSNSAELQVDRNQEDFLISTYSIDEIIDHTKNKVA